MTTVWKDIDRIILIKIFNKNNYESVVELGFNCSVPYTPMMREFNARV